MNPKIVIFIIVSAASHLGLLLAIFLLINLQDDTSKITVTPANNTLQVSFLQPAHKNVGDTIKPTEKSLASHPNQTMTSNTQTTNLNSKALSDVHSASKAQNFPSENRTTKTPPAIDKINHLLKNSIELANFENTTIFDFEPTTNTIASTNNSTAQTNTTGIIGEKKYTQQPIEINKTLKKVFWQHFYYPRIARKNGWQGLVKLGLRIESNGKLSNIRVIKTSGYNSLDEAAIASLQNIVQLEDAETWLNGLHFDTELPVHYKLLDS